MNEYVAGLILVLVGGLYYFKSQSDKNKRDAVLGETKGRDKELSAQQDKIRDEINAVKEQDDSKLTPDERADRWNK